MQINETIRKDGLRIISCKLPHKKSVLVELVARVGHAYDPPDKCGLFHLFEHMAFKGTKKRSFGELQSFSLRNLFGRNAGTGALGTTYKASVIDRKLPLACDYLCDIYCNSTFPESELEKEKKIVSLEIASVRDDDASIAGYALKELLYEENPKRLYGGGTLEGLKNIRGSDLLEQKKNWHVPASTVAIAVGSVNHKDFVREISKCILYNPKKVTLKKWSDESDRLPAKKDAVLLRPKREKAILLVGCKIPEKLDNRKREAFSLFSKLIVNPNKSRLWNEIREKRGLAYVVDGGYSGTAGLGGTFSVYIEFDPSKQEEVGKVLWQSLLIPLTKKRDFEEMREKIYDAFEVAVVEQGGDYESDIWRKIVDDEPVKSVEREYERRLKVISSLTLKDLEMARKEFIKQERFATVFVKSGDSEISRKII